MSTDYADDFNRGSLGTNAANGQPFTHVGGTWTIASNKLLAPSVAGDSFLVWEHGASDVQFEADTPDGDADWHGFIFRYSDAVNWWVIGILDGDIWTYRSEAGLITVIDVTPYTPGLKFNVQIIGVEFRMYVDDVFVNRVTGNGFNLSETIIGFSNNVVPVEFDNLRVDTVPFVPAIIPLSMVAGGETMEVDTGVFVFAGVVDVNASGFVGPAVPGGGATALGWGVGHYLYVGAGSDQGQA